MRRSDWGGVNTLRIRQISGRPDASDGALKGPAQSKPQAENGGRFRLTRHRVNLALIILALLYAIFAGLHTVFDLDMGWHLATGRYVVQHHVIPRTDVLSYTSTGTEWIYPPFAGVLLYVNIAFLPLGRSYGIETQVLLSLCQRRTSWLRVCVTDRLSDECERLRANRTNYPHLDRILRQAYVESGTWWER